MGKKRVYELAKELGFTNNHDLIEKLQKLGFDVKSHSSTIDEAEVRRALKADEDARRAKTDESRVGTGLIRRRPRPGSVIRRRPGEADDGAEGDEVVETRAPGRADSDLRAPEPVAPEPEATPVAAEPEPPQPPPVVVAPVAPVDPPVAPVTAAEPPIAAVAAATPAEAVAADAAAGGATDAGAAAPAAAGEPGADDEDRKDRRDARAVRPERRREVEYDEEEDEKPDLEVDDVGISLSDFVMPEARDQDVNRLRVAPPPPSTKILPTKKEEEPQSKIVRTIDPKVLKDRLAQSKRPEPPKEWGKPGEVAASPFNEFVVKTDASGKKRELVDVRKEAAKGRAGKLGQKKREEMTARDLLEHRRGQVYYPAPGKRKLKGGRKGVQKRPDVNAPGVKKPISIGETIAIAELASQTGVKAKDILAFLLRQGMMVTSINQPIPNDVATLVATEFGFDVTSKMFEEEDLLESGVSEEEEDPGAVLRAPVVTVMGHVDHGKTSFLDRVRSTNVAAGEAGGITQRIAGYQVKTAKGLITFLDTPGHAAFTAMRARGADITDIVILMVAADDGVMPQTLEAIRHAKEAEVPIIVALNKIDKPEASPDRVLQQLSGAGVLVEEWGGQVPCYRISAKTGQGVDELLELVALQAEIMELKANPDAPAKATVIEAFIDKGRGPVATVLVGEGTLRIGDNVVVGESTGKIRAMMAADGRRVKEATPSMPVQVLGLDVAPQPADELRVAPDAESAKKIAAHRREKRRAGELSGTARVSLQDLFSRLQKGEQKELKILVKGDLQGSVEALRDALAALSNEQVKVVMVGGGVGAIVESDVEFARASDAIVIGFAVRPDTKALKSARALGVEIRTHEVIYEILDEVRLAMQGLLAPVSQERYLGRAEVRQTFNVPKVGTIAGCAVVDGIITRQAQIRLIRDGKSVYQGRLASLKRFKDDAREVKEGFECGMGIERYNDVKVGDIIEAFEVVEVKPMLSEPAPKGEVRA